MLSRKSAIRRYDKNTKVIGDDRTVIHRMRHLENTILMLQNGALFRHRVIWQLNAHVPRSCDYHLKMAQEV